MYNVFSLTYLRLGPLLDLLDPRLSPLPLSFLGNPDRLRGGESVEERREVFGEVLSESAGLLEWRRESLLDVSFDSSADVELGAVTTILGESD